MKKAFTMLELILVVVVIGIISAFAIPKIFGSKKDAEILKLKTQVSEINKSIKTYTNSKMVLSGNMDEEENYPEELNENGVLLGKVLSVASVKGWVKGKRNKQEQDFLYDYTMKGYGTFYCAYIKPGSIAQEHASWEYNRGKAIPNDPKFPIGSFKCFKFENTSKKIDNTVIDKVFN